MSRYLRAISVVVLGIACAEQPSRDASATMDTARPADTVATRDTTAATRDSIAADSAAKAALIPEGLLISPWATEVDSAARARSWFVLRKRGEVTELIPTRVDTATLPRPCADTGVSVRPTAINGMWIVMLSNVEGLRAGAVEAMTITTESLMKPLGAGDSVTLTFRGEPFVIRAEASAADSAFALVHDARGGRLTVGDSIATSQWWRILWAGDLNRDGAPDVMIESSSEDSGRLISLYMSGAVPPNRRWRPVAEEAHHGC